MAEQTRTPKPRVIVVGGGVAALETVLALRDLAADQVEVSVLTSSDAFVMRPLAVREPFSFGAADRYDLAPILADLETTLIAEDLLSVDSTAQTVLTKGGQVLPYDALVVACGARTSVRYEHAVTIDDRKIDELLHGMIQDIEGDYIHSLAFIAPPRMGWPLPLYDLALMTAHRAWDMGIDLKTTIITPEERPLHAFGSVVSDGVASLLRERNIDFVPLAHVEVPQRRHITVNPGNRQLHIERVIALPELFGPGIEGLPQDEFGFVPVDEECRVTGAGPVYAAGDAANFPIKHGGIGSQMADTAARAIAALAGAPVTATPLDPIIRGLLLTGGAPKYMYAHLVGGHAFDSEFSDTPIWDPPSKISSLYLAPYLEARSRSAA